MTAPATLSRPLYLVFEGLDGSGKTTQARRLAERLRARGLVVRELVEPTHGPIGEEIRRRAREGPPLLAREELDLFLQDRRANVREGVLPALARNEVIIQDRSFFSTVAYQGARPDLGLSRDEIVALHEEFPRPDLVLLVDVELDRAVARIQARGVPDAFEQRSYLERVLANFRSMEGVTAGVPVHTIDGMRAIEDVERLIWAIVEPRLLDRLRSG